MIVRDVRMDTYGEWEELLDARSINTFGEFRRKIIAVFHQHG